MTTVIYGETTTEVGRGPAEGDEDLWLTLPDLTAATGWEIKPEGVCRDELCVPLPADREQSILREDGSGTWFNLGEFARFIDQPLAHDGGAEVWYFGAPSRERSDALRLLLAPDFELPDFEGQTHRLSDLRGKKVLLALWASW